MVSYKLDQAAEIPPTIDVIVNEQDSYKLKLRDGYFFAGEVNLDDGVNEIVVAGKTTFVFAGDDEKPRQGYSKQYGHVGADDTCDECHTAETDAKGKVTLGLQEAPETLCNWCHYQVSNPKRGQEARVMHPPVKEGKCLNCHLHHSGTRPALLKDDPRKLCQACHQKLYEDLNTKPHVHGPINVGGCDLCHVQHWSSDPFLLKMPEGELCAQCHSDMDKNPAVGRHPGVKEGRCHQCHNAHASSNPKMMVKIVNNLCVDCHPEKSHNFHEEKGFSIYICGRCHDIHRPDTLNLIVNESRDLCYSCHQNLGKGEFVHKVVAEKSCFECHGFHEESIGQSQSEICHRCHPADDRFRAKHPVKMTAEVRCTGCHSPHRAANANLTLEFKHKPFGEGSCASCHDKIEFLKGEGVAGGGDALCFTCHQDKLIPAEKASVIIHKPYANQSCRACHLPHNSEYPYLLNTETLDLCGNCHSSVKKLKSFMPTSSHPFVKDGLCGKCHDSHIGRRSKLLKDEPKKLCLSCHAKLLQAEDGAPLPRLHEPAVKEDCSSCHTGHSSRYPGLLKEKEATVCQKCHMRFFRTLDRVGNLSVHAPAKAADCGSCHDLHGSANPGMVKKLDNSLCMPCHEKLKRGSHHLYDAAFETYASGGELQGTRVACLDCHLSHSSPNKRLLAKLDAQICRECHTF